MDRRDPDPVEEIENEVEIAVDGLAIRGDLADCTRAARIEIETPLVSRMRSCNAGTAAASVVIGSSPNQI
jgi:hypothetical protein